MAIKKLRTPIIKPRRQGGTFYTFSSALEDVGLNINELKNKVALSHYVLLDIPAFKFDGVNGNPYGTNEDDFNQGDYTFAESLQNYALNFETVLRNQDSYNFAESLTVSERVFWKFMKTAGFMTFEKEESGYYVNNSNVVKGFGLITAGAQRTDAYGIYNETFVQIPSSYGQMKVLFKPVSDKNYHITTSSEDYFYASDSSGLLENLDVSDYDASTNLLFTGIPAEAQYDSESDKAYIVEDESEELCVEFSLDKLREYYGRESLSFDDIGQECLGIELENQVSAYTFNAILVYYSIYDSTGKNILATNAYGLLLLDSAVPHENIDTIDSGENYFIFPQLEKKQTTSTTAGSSYAFRLNIKTSSVYSGNVIVNDESTAGYAMSTEFNDVIRNMNAAIETLKSNANVIAAIASDNNQIKKFALDSMDKIDDLKKDIATLKSGKTKNINANSVTTSTITANNIQLLTSNTLDIYDSDTGEEYGYFDASTFHYKTINADNFTGNNAFINNMGVNTISAQKDDIVFSGDSTQQSYAKINENGIYSNGEYFMKSPENTFGSTEITGEEASRVFELSQVMLDTSVGYYIKLPSLGESDELSPRIINSLYTSSSEDSGVTTSGNDYYNLTSIVSLLIAEVKYLKERCDSLES